MALTQAPKQSSNPGAQQQATTRKDKALMVALIALLGAGATGYGLLVEMRAAFVTWGLTFEVASWLASMVASETELPDLGLGVVGPMQQRERRQAHAWRALYALSAAQRLQEADDLAHAQTVERGYFGRHVGAEERRDRAAALVDVTARLLADRREEQVHESMTLLGWRAVLDWRTTPECRWANGKNYRTDRIPVIGIPGSVHPRCRCTSGPPIPGAPLIPSM